MTTTSRFKRKITFTQTGGSNQPPAVQLRGCTTPAPKDHRGWALWWSEAALRAIENYIRDGNPLDLEHAHRCGRFTWWHAARAKRYYYWDSQKREGSI